MLRQREILSLLSLGRSQNTVCGTLHCSKRNVSEVSKAARDRDKSYGELLALSDSELLTVLSPQKHVLAEDPRDFDGIGVCCYSFDVFDNITHPTSLFLCSVWRERRGAILVFGYCAAWGLLVLLHSENIKTNWIR